MAVSDYSTTAASNTTISGIDISGTTGKVKDGDNAIRQIMADIKAGVPYLSGTNYLIESTDAGATVGPVFELYRNSASPAASDILGKVLFNGEDSAGNTQEYASIEATILDATSTSEDGSLDFYATVAGTRTKLASVTGTGLGVADGTVSLPGLTFNADQNTGIYRVGSDNIGITAGGTKIIDVTTAGFGVAGVGTIISSAAGTVLGLQSNDAGATLGPVLNLDRNSASPAANDVIGGIQFMGRDAGAAQEVYARIQSVIVDTTAGSEDAYLTVAADKAGTLTDYLHIGANAAGTATANATGLPLGQLSFPATQNASSDANTLDDYEEGTTTPTPSSGSGSFTSVTCTLYYTKIGRLVYINGEVITTTVGTAATDIRITLPFSSANLGGNVSVGRYYNRTSGATGGRVAITANSGTMFWNTDAGGFPTTADGQVLDFSAVYTAAT